MDELSLTETELRYFGDLFLCCDVDKTEKIPVLKATELFRSANLSNDVIRQITLLSGIPQTALHISRTQFYSCLKLIAAYQASVPLRIEVISSSAYNLPLPRFSWKESPPPINRNSGITTINNSGVIGVGLPSLSMSGSISTTVVNSISSPSSAVTASGISITSVASNAGVATSTVNSNETNGLISTNNTIAVAATLGNSSSSMSSNPVTSHDPNSKQWREVRSSPDLIELSNIRQDVSNSDLQSTDSEVEQNETSSGRRRNRGGSPEAWSTNSDSPTPTNSVAERSWAKESLWQGILGDEHRQLLGTEEESSDKHSSDDDNDADIESLYQITQEQREYYHKQFKAVQPDPNGLLSGHIARVFFEKSRIPIEELRHIWQLCDVTRDGALSLAEFTAAMHLVVLRRNNIPLPSILPPCLHPTVLNQVVQQQQQPVDPPEGDLLHLGDDDKTESPSINSSSSNTNKQKLIEDNDHHMLPLTHSYNKNVMNLSSLSSTSQVSVINKQHNVKVSNCPVSGQSKMHCDSTSPPQVEPTTPPNPKHRRKELAKDWSNQNKEWTKFTESPTSNVSSPGPKPVNFDMQRTAQAVVSDPQILHPVPLRVTPVGAEAVEDDQTLRMQKRSENLVYDNTTGILRENESSPKQQLINQQNPHHSSSAQQQHRESLQGGSDLRAIQRPQPKKIPAKSIGAIPPPPQREPSFGSGSNDTIEVLPSGSSNIITTLSSNKKDPPPLPPPRPHRHARSSSLDLNKLKMSGNPSQTTEIITQNSFEVQTDTGFADFTHFPEDTSKSMPHNEQLSTSYIEESIDHSSSIPNIPPPLQSSGSSNAATAVPVRPVIPSQRVSAFEVYRKPNSTSTTTPRSSQSPEIIQPQLQQSFQHQHHYQTTAIPSQPIPLSLSSTATTNNNSSLNTAVIPPTSGSEYEKRVSAISETLRHVSFKQDRNIIDVLRHLREQNVLLLRLCNDLSEELLTVQQKKEEIRSKLESSTPLNNTISGTISTNITGGSGNSGIHSNV